MKVTDEMVEVGLRAFGEAVDSLASDRDVARRIAEAVATAIARAAVEADRKADEARDPSDAEVGEAIAAAFPEAPTARKDAGALAWMRAALRADRARRPRAPVVAFDEAGIEALIRIGREALDTWPGPRDMAEPEAVRAVATAAAEAAFAAYLRTDRLATVEARITEARRALRMPAPAPQAPMPPPWRESVIGVVAPEEAPPPVAASLREEVARAAESAYVLHADSNAAWLAAADAAIPIVQRYDVARFTGAEAAAVAYAAYAKASYAFDAPQPDYDQRLPGVYDEHHRRNGEHRMMAALRAAAGAGGGVVEPECDTLTGGAGSIYRCTLPRDHEGDHNRGAAFTVDMLPALEAKHDAEAPRWLRERLASARAQRDEWKARAEKLEDDLATRTRERDDARAERDAAEAGRNRTHAQWSESDKALRKEIDALRSRPVPEVAQEHCRMCGRTRKPAEERNGCDAEGMTPHSWEAALAAPVAVEPTSSAPTAADFAAVAAEADLATRMRERVEQTERNEAALEGMRVELVKRAENAEARASRLERERDVARAEVRRLAEARVVAVAERDQARVLHNRAAAIIAETCAVLDVSPTSDTDLAEEVRRALRSRPALAAPAEGSGAPWPDVYAGPDGRIVSIHWIEETQRRIDSLTEQVAAMKGGATCPVDTTAIEADMRKCERVLARENCIRASQSCRDLADAVASILRREVAAMKGGAR